MPSHDERALALSPVISNGISSDVHLSLFASDLRLDGEWHLMDIIAESGSYSILSTTSPVSDQQSLGEYSCPSRSGYCLSTRINNFNSQHNYGLFHFVCELLPFLRMFHHER